MPCEHLVALEIEVAEARWLVVQAVAALAVSRVLAAAHGHVADVRVVEVIGAVSGKGLLDERYVAAVARSRVGDELRGAPDAAAVTTAAGAGEGALDPGLDAALNGGFDGGGCSAGAITMPAVPVALLAFLIPVVVIPSLPTVPTCRAVEIALVPRAGGIVVLPLEIGDQVDGRAVVAAANACFVDLVPALSLKEILPALVAKHAPAVVIFALVPCGNQNREPISATAVARAFAHCSASGEAVPAQLILPTTCADLVV